MTKLIICGKEVLLDDEDVLFVNQHRWHINNRGYLYTSIRHRFILLHRSIMKAPIGRIVDHINKLDNRKENLRFCTNSQNLMNTGKWSNNRSSKFRGVTLIKSANKWRATVKINKQKFYLGLFEHELDAARAYNDTVTEHCKDFALLNAI